MLPRLGLRPLAGLRGALSAVPRPEGRWGLWTAPSVPGSGGACLCGFGLPREASAAGLGSGGAVSRRQDRAFESRRTRRPARVGRSLLPEGRVRLGVPPSAPFDGVLPRAPASMAFPEGSAATPSPQPPVPGFRGIRSPLATDRGSGQFGIVLHRWRRSCPRTRHVRWPEPAFALSQVLASDTEVPKSRRHRGGFEVRARARPRPASAEALEP